MAYVGVCACDRTPLTARPVKSLLVNSMEKWTVMLCSGNSEFGEVEIKRRIFQDFYPL